MSLLYRNPTLQSVKSRKDVTDLANAENGLGEGSAFGNTATYFWTFHFQLHMWHLQDKNRLKDGEHLAQADKCLTTGPFWQQMWHLTEEKST